MRSTMWPPNLLRSLVGLFTTAGLVFLSLVAGVAKAPVALAAEPLRCAADTIYAVNSSGQIRAVTIGDNSIVVSSENTATGQSANGLAISPGGQYAYTVDNGQTKDRTIKVYNSETDTTAEHNVTVSGDYSDYGIRGAYDPKSGLYYFGGYRQIAAFDPGTGAAFRVGTLVGPGHTQLGNNNGDWAFGSDGTLYVLSGKTLYTAVLPLPTSESTGDVLLKKEIDLDGLSDGTGVTAPNGIAFGAGGRLFISYGTAGSAYIAEYNLETGKRVGTAKSQSFVASDLGSCVYPNTLKLTVNVERFQDGDQFAMGIDGDTFDETKTATTTGNVDGLQDQFAGPVFTDNGENYSLSVDAAGTTDLTNYDGTISCLNETSGEELVPEGSAFEWNLDFPGTLGTDVACTVTLTPRLPGLKLDKTSDPAPGAGVKAGDTVTYTVTAENTGSVKLDPVELSDNLSGLLDNATYNNDATLVVTDGDGVPVTADDPELSDDGKSLAWTGSLDPGSTAVRACKVKCVRGWSGSRM